MTKYETVVGLEIHAHLNTESKMFCSCGTGPRGKEYRASEKDEPNIRVCPICMGHPGTLPVPNKRAIEDTILLGLALNAKIPESFNFERKNYYYPDLPKAYQITSATNPPVVGGYLEVETVTGTKKVNLDHIHLEEDAGKLTHSKSGDYSLVDLNRAGTPLLEIVTMPEMSSGAEAAEFMRNLKSILRALGISDADMEKGQMRCDANISVRPVGSKKLGVKVEVKNINSFKMVQKAIDYESERQIEMLENNERILQETRGWSEAKGKTVGQRSKEFANDYRYFPEPDIPPIEIGRGKAFDPEVINDRLPELPKEKKSRFILEYGLAPREAEVIADNLELAEYFEKTIEGIESEPLNAEARKQRGSILAKLITGTNADLEKIIAISRQDLADLVEFIRDDDLSFGKGKELFNVGLVKEGKSLQALMEGSVKQISGEEELGTIVTKVLENCEKEVDRYRAGEKQLFGFLVGQVMKESNGQANPKVAGELIRKELE